VLAAQSLGCEADRGPWVRGIAHRVLGLILRATDGPRELAEDHRGLSFPALWSVSLARGFLSRRPASECAVELIERRQAHLWLTACGTQPKVVLGIKLCERYGGHSSTSLFRLTPRARAKSLSRWCLVAGKRMVSVDTILLLQRC